MKVYIRPVVESVSLIETGMINLSLHDEEGGEQLSKQRGSALDEGLEDNSSYYNPFGSDE